MQDIFILALMNIGNGRGGFLKDFLVKTIMQKAINVSDLLIFISKAVEKSFQDNFKIDENKCVIVYNGINKKFLESKQIEKQKENTNIIFVGRLEKVKGVDILIKAFGEVYDKDNKIQLTIVGNGTERKNLENLAKEVKGSENIKFVGRQNNVIDWLDKSNIFVYPSIWEEGFGISVIEAMSRGCIPITFRKGGLVEIIENGKNGYLVEEVDYKKLSDAILKVINLNNEEREKMIENAINTSKKFTIEKTIQTLGQAYKNLK